MSVLARFRKPGGFQQLLAVVETCEPIKQKALLHLIAVEDPGWAQLVRLKSLSFERILSWPVEILMELTPPLSDKVLSTIYQLAQQTPGLGEKWIHSLPTIKAREIQSLADDLASTPSERIAAVVLLIQVTREMESEGQIRFAHFDPLLQVDKDIAA